jgi:drug/metabolite transporter (DMT)-like permease
MTTIQRGILYGLLAAAIWGGMYIVSDIVLAVIPPFTLLTMRLLLGGLVLGTVLLWKRSANSRQPSGIRLQPTTNTQQPIPNSRPPLTPFLLTGLLGFGISVGAQFVGTDLSNGVNGALITTASPAFILIFAALLLREKLTVRRIAAVALASIGVIIILDLTQVDFSSSAFAGNLALVVAALTWGLYSVLARRVGKAHDTLWVTLLFFVGGLFLTVPAALIELNSRPIGQMDSGVILGVLYLGVVSTAGAMWLWNRAFALVNAGVASLTFFAQPLVGALLGALIGQAITPVLMIGGVLVALGVLLAIRE